MKYASREDAPGTQKAAPDFELSDVNGKAHKLSDYKGKWVVLEWMNYTCPYVKKHYDESHSNMQKLQKTYTDKGVVWLSICSSGEGKPGYMTPEEGKAAFEERKAAATALLLDPTGAVGHKFAASVTPEIRIIDPQGRVVYSGAIDDIRSAKASDVEKAKNHVAAVLDAVLAGKAEPYSVTRPYG